MAIAADNVIFGLPEVKVGVFPDAGAEPAPAHRAAAPRQRMGAHGEPFDAQGPTRRRPRACSTTSWPAAELDAKVDWLIGRIVDKSPTAIRRGKYAMRADRRDVVRREHRLH
ncbi:hypothetical protein [Bradyrhizobium sp. RDT46]|uniref:hypothetical protein n=1 Tax=Bradyrhizobium sp. RDT46 TaxID=3341829 RepID=UPI0035C7443A